MCFMLGNITIRYIYNTQHLNIIYIISYFDIFPIFRVFYHYNILAIILIILHRTDGPSGCLLFTYLKYICRYWRPINLDYSWLSFDYIAYSVKNTGERCILVIYGHKGECISLISIILIFCLSCRNHIQDITRSLFIIVLHFVKSFMWYWSVSNQYSYYCYFFCLGPAYRICHHHRHVWVRCFETTIIMVSCMSLILINMPYFSFNIILSYHLRRSEPRVVSRYLPIVSALWTVSSYIQVNNTTYQKVSAIYWKY